MYIRYKEEVRHLPETITLKLGTHKGKENKIKITLHFRMCTDDIYRASPMHKKITINRSLEVGLTEYGGLSLCLMRSSTQKKR